MSTIKILRLAPQVLQSKIKAINSEGQQCIKTEEDPPSSQLTLSPKLLPLFPNIPSIFIQPVFVSRYFPYVYSLFGCVSHLLHDSVIRHLLCEVFLDALSRMHHLFCSSLHLVFCWKH